MKKHISMILSVVMAIAMLTMLTGCGSETEKFIGTWETTVNLTDTINQQFAEDEEMANYLKADKFELRMLFTFNEDGTHKVSIDKESFDRSLESLSQNCVEGMKKYLEDTAKASGLNMSIDELLTLSGTTMDALSEELINQIKSSSDTMVKDMELEGKFEVKDGKLYTNDNKDEAINEQEYETYEFVNDNELKLLEGFGEDNEEAKELYPVTLKKVK